MYYGVRNQTYALNISYDFFGIFKFNFDSIHFNEAKARKSRHFGFAQDLAETKEKFELDNFDMDGETLRLKLTSVSLDADVVSSISILGWTFEFNHLEIKDIGIEFIINKEDLS